VSGVEKILEIFGGSESFACAMVVWTTTCNADSILSNFAAELGKDVQSKGGSFKDDFAAVVAANNLVPCPFVSVTGGETLGTACRIDGCAVDLPTWRAFLLAASTVNSAIVEIDVMNCTLTLQHLQDLAAALVKIGNLAVLKLDYITIASNAGDDASPANLFKPFIWGSAAPVEYLSLKGNNLGDAFCTDPSILSALSGNFTLQCLSLADNGITDEGAASILKALRLAVSIKCVSLAKNSIRGDALFFGAVCDLLAGTGAASAEDESTWKNASKVIGDRNKALKDINKQRQKAGYAALSDVAPPAERIAKVDGVNAIVNRGITSLDLSFNPLEGFSAFAACVSTLRAPCRISTAPPLDLRVVLRGTSPSSPLLGAGADDATPVVCDLTDGVLIVC